MKKLLCTLAAVAVAISASALDIFNHLGAGAGVGTNGISVELNCTPKVRQKTFGVQFSL